MQRLVERDPGLLASVDGSGWSALDYAAWAAQKPVYDYLVFRGGRTDLFTEAALGPWPAFQERLRARSGTVDERDPRQKATALIWAARTGNGLGAELLLSLGADPDAADREGRRALHHAAARGDLELARSLLQAGADSGAADGRGGTALHLACAAVSFPLVELLVGRGAPLAPQDQDGNTPLHAAAARGSLEICEYLLLHGAPKSAKNRRGQTPRELAAAFPRLARMLEGKP